MYKQVIYIQTRYIQIKLFVYKLIWRIYFVYFYPSKKSVRISSRARAKSNVKRPKSNEQQAKTKEEQAKINEQRAKPKEKQAKINEQRAKSVFS